MAAPTLVERRLRHGLTVRFAETDLMGIVHHATYLTYFEAGRVSWLKQRGISYDSWVQKGIHLPVVEANVRYRRPARFDDELEVEAWVSDLTRASVRFSYRVLRGGEVLAEGFTLLACVGHNLGVRRLPDDVIAVLSGE